MSTSSHDSNASHRVRLQQTAVFCAAFVGLGLCGGAMGPSLAAHAARTGTQLETISAVFIAIALGRLLSSTGGAWLIDRLRGETQLIGGTLCAAAAIALVPFTMNLPALFIVLLIYGTAANLLDIGANTLIVRVHGAQVGPYMNAMHLSFGVGGSIAPLIVGRSYAYTGDVAVAYWVNAGVLVLLALCMLRVPALPRMDAAHRAAQARTPRFMLVMLGAFFFFMVAVEVGGMQWTFAFGERLGLSREVGAAMLSSGFWWAYSAARLLAIPISLRVRPGTYVAVDLVGTFLCALIALIGLLVPTAQPLTWIGIIGMGFFIASAFPSMMSFVGSRIPVTGSLNGLLFAASNIGAMVGPWTIGQLFDVVGPLSLPLLAMLGMAAALALFVVIGKGIGDRK